MTDGLLLDLSQTMALHGFQSVPNTSTLAHVALLLKRQTWNTNRAIVVVCPAQIPVDIHAYLRQLRRQIAFKCGFFPFFWGIGIQVIIQIPGHSKTAIDPIDYVARVDNQWAIIQSIFLTDPASRTFRSGCTWGQFVTGKFQNKISEVLSRHLLPDSSNQKV